MCLLRISFFLSACGHHVIRSSESTSTKTLAPKASIEHLTPGLWLLLRGVGFWEEDSLRLMQKLSFLRWEQQTVSTPPRRACVRHPSHSDHCFLRHRTHGQSRPSLFALCCNHKTPGPGYIMKQRGLPALEMQEHATSIFSALWALYGSSIRETEGHSKRAGQEARELAEQARLFAASSVVGANALCVIRVHPF